ncbi:Fur family transcriptional regulator [Clostridium sp. 19966]|nr:iron dependent repressor, metal binding and dimerization domain protein [Clostridium sp. 19966]MDT8717641.1 Fur family transcriptional regulator [Clostridium sp. 19966]
MDNKHFYTFNEYMKKDNNLITASMEDYIEMIYRLSRDNGFTRVHELSTALNVQPPSATKMVQKLSDLGLINYQKYGVIILQKHGEDMGEALLKRHELIEALLSILGAPQEDLLEETEKIEHTISQSTLCHIENFVNFISSHPEIIKKYQQTFKKKNKR